MSLRNALFTREEQDRLFNHTFLKRERLEEQYASVQQRLDAHVLARLDRRGKLAPELRRLVLVFPLELGVAWRKVTLLSPKPHFSQFSRFTAPHGSDLRSRHMVPIRKK